MKVFLSWSDQTSHKVACALGDWLPYVIQAVTIFVSSENINKGERWNDELVSQLKETSPLGYFGILTNYQNFRTGLDHSEAWDHFELNHWFENRPLDHSFTLVQRIGAYASMTGSDEEELRQLLQELKPAKAIIGKTIEVIREMADRPKAKGLIGKQLSTIIIPRELPSNVEVSYHSDIVTYNAYAPAQIVALSDENRHIILEASMQRGDDQGLKPIAFPKVGRNTPYPCKSGKKYKRCCGQ